MHSCSIQQTMDYIFIYFFLSSNYSPSHLHYPYTPVPSDHLYTYIKFEQPETNFPNFRIRSNNLETTNSENAIWQKLEKCPLGFSLVVTNLVKGFMGFVAGQFFFKPIRLFRAICMHAHTNLTRAMWKVRLHNQIVS